MKRRFLKKTSTVIFLLVAMAMVFSACAETDNTQKPENTSSDNTVQKTEEKTEEVITETAGDDIEVVFWNLFTGGDGEIMKQIVDEYNEMTPGVTIVNTTQDWGQYYTKLRTAVLGGTSPDLGVTHVTKARELAVNDLIIPIDTAFADNGIDIDWSNYSDNIMTYCTVDGGRYVLPIDNLVFLLYYNKSIVQEAGLLSADGKVDLGEGYDGFINALKQVQDNTEFYPLASPNNGWPVATLWYTLYKQMGAENLLAEDLKSTDIDGEKALAALDSLQNIYQYVPEKLTDAYEFFAKEKSSAFMLDGPWSVNAALEALGDDLGIMPFPDDMYATPATWTDAHSFILPNKPQRDDATTKAALDFVKWFTDNNWKWSQAGHVPANKLAWDSEEFKNLPLRGDYVGAGKNVISFPATENVWLTFAPELYEPIENMIMGNTDSAETLTEIQNKLDTALGK